MNWPTALLECRGLEASASAREFLSWHCGLNHMPRWAPGMVAYGPGVKDGEEKGVRREWEETVH